MAVHGLLNLGPLIGPAMLAQGVKLEDVPRYIAEKSGVPERLLRTEEEKMELASQVASAAQQNPEGTAMAVGALTGAGA